MESLSSLSIFVETLISTSCDEGDITWKIFKAVFGKKGLENESSWYCKM
jgi:hypothetical protein